MIAFFYADIRNTLFMSLQCAYQRVMTVFRVFLCLSCSAFAACSQDKAGEILVLSYDNFGPQVIAGEIVGMEWWQWQSHGESRRVDYDVKVVVYRNLRKEVVEKDYPVIPEDEKDFRYLEYDVALAYLDEKINENIMDSVTERLRNTKQEIVDMLGKP